MSNQRVAVMSAVSLSLVALAGCPAPGAGTGTTTGGGGGGATAISPGACGTINTSAAGRKLYAFLVASAELDRASLELENTVAGACRKMADILGVSSAGPTRDVCLRAAAELDANLQVSVKTESRLVTRTVPPVCTTKVDLAASFAAECEARAEADIRATCEGRCTGTCSGSCAGTCAAQGANGQCAGACDGTCSGTCSGGCEGYAHVDASAECQASAEVRASLRTECTEPRVEVVRESVTVVDDTKFQKAMAAIDAGMPELLRAGAKLNAAGKALGLWAQTGASLVKESGSLVGQLGEKGVCVAGQLAGVVAAAANIQARFEVSIEVSAKVSASAGTQ